MSDLVAFYRARLGEKEWAAQAAKDAAAKRTHYRAGMIAAADRELREVAAARVILSAYERAEAEREPYEPEYAYGVKRRPR